MYTGGLIRYRQELDAVKQSGYDNITFHRPDDVLYNA